MTDDLELLALELGQDLRLVNEQVHQYKDSVTELTKNLNCSTQEVTDLKIQLTKALADVQGLRAQLQVRTEATQRLEVENSNMRDSLAKLNVQVESNVVERQRLLQRCQMVENERFNWKGKCEEMQKSGAECAAYKAQCHVLQTQLRSTVSQIIRQQELLAKDFSKMERSVQEAMSFAKTVNDHSVHQTAYAKKTYKIKEDMEKKVVELSVKLAEVVKERDDLLDTQKGLGANDGKRYLSEWQTYQLEMKKRIDGYMEENEKLVEELDLVRAQKVDVICKECQLKMEAKQVLNTTEETN